MKTRLSPALPAPLASGLYAALLADTVAAAGAARADARTLWWASAGAEFAPPGFGPRFQAGADLGARLANTFSALLAEPDATAVVIGSDAPALTTAHIEAAFAALEEADVALGPAADGGYWGIGLKRAAPGLFRDIAWSTDRVLAQTRERAGANGLRVALLEPLADLDTPADLAALCGALARGDAACGPNARAVLAGLGLARAAG